MRPVISHELEPRHVFRGRGTFGGGTVSSCWGELKTRDPKEEDSQVEWSYYTTFTQGEVDLASRLAL